MNAKIIRARTGLSQKNFAKKFEIPVHTLQEWEQGYRNPSEYVLKMMDYILDLEEQLYGEILQDKNISK